MLESKNSLREYEPLKSNSSNIESKTEQNSSIQSNSNLIKNEPSLDLDNHNMENNNEEQNMIRLKSYFPFKNFSLITIGPNSKF